MNVSVIGFQGVRDELRRVEADDLTLSLTKTYAEAFAGGDWNEKHDPKELLAKWDGLIRSGRRAFLECRRNSVVVGGGAFASLKNFPDKIDLLPDCCLNSFFIEELWVTPEFQGKQIGRFILVNMEQMILDSGSKKISLWTHQTSKRLNKFYSVNGYQAVHDVLPNDSHIKRKVFYKNLDTPVPIGGHRHA